MSGKSIARRLQVSSRFTCPRCGGREAYGCGCRTAFERYVLNMVMVQPVRCCDCDGLSYAFPMRLEGPILAGNERTALAA